MHEHQLRNKRAAPFCAATKVAPAPEEEEWPDTMDTCKGCGTFRMCAYVMNQGEKKPYCKAQCEVKARRGSISARNSSTNIPPRSGR